MPLHGVQVITAQTVTPVGRNPLIAVRPLLALDEPLPNLEIKYAALAPGAEVERSVHDDKDELFYVMGGVVYFSVNGGSYKAYAENTLITIPAGTVHSYRVQAGGQAVTVLTVFWSVE